MCYDYHGFQREWFTAGRVQILPNMTPATYRDLSQLWRSRTGEDRTAGRAPWWETVKLVCFAYARADAYEGRIPYRLVLARAGELIQERDARAGGRPRRTETARRLVDRCLVDLSREHPDALVLDRAGARQTRFVVVDERRWRGHHQAVWLSWMFTLLGTKRGEPVTAGWLARQVGVERSMAGRWLAGTSVMGSERVIRLAQVAAVELAPRILNEQSTPKEKRGERRVKAVLRQVESALRVLLGDAAGLGDVERTYVLVDGLRTLGFCRFLLSGMETGLSAEEAARATAFTHGRLLPVEGFLPDDAHDLAELSEAATWLHATAQRNGLSVTRLVSAFERPGVPAVVDLENAVSVGPTPALLRRLAERVLENRAAVAAGAKPRLAMLLEEE